MWLCAVRRAIRKTFLTVLLLTLVIGYRTSPIFIYGSAMVISYLVARYWLTGVVPTRSAIGLMMVVPQSTDGFQPDT